MLNYIKIMKINNWMKIVQNRNECKRAVEKAKSFAVAYLRIRRIHGHIYLSNSAVS
jgi:hypothetical protein